MAWPMTQRQLKERRQRQNCNNNSVGGRGWSARVFPSMLKRDIRLLLMVKEKNINRSRKLKACISIILKDISPTNRYPLNSTSSSSTKRETQKQPHEKEDQQTYKIKIFQVMFCLKNYMVFVGSHNVTIMFNLL